MGQIRTGGLTLVITSSRQKPLFDVRSFIPTPYDEWSFLGVLERFGSLVILDSDFPDHDMSDGGSARWCPVLLSKLVIIQRKESWTDRKAVSAACNDLQIKACLGLGVEQQGPSQPTLVRHRQRMQELNLGDKYLSRFVELGMLLEVIKRGGAVVVDSVPVNGAGQVLDTYNLIAAGTRRGLRRLAAVSGEGLPALADRLEMTRYIQRSVKGTFDIDWSDGEARRGLLAQLVADALRVRDELKVAASAPAKQPPVDDEPPPPVLPGLEPNTAQPEPREQPTAVVEALEEAAEFIEDVLEHDIDVGANGEVKGIIQRAAGDRPISATDSDMRHGRKSASVIIAGYKVQIVATAVYAFVVLAELIRANEHDGVALPRLVVATESQGLTPEWWGGDHAYGTLANHSYFKQLDAELVARMPRPVNGGRYTKDEFHLDFESKTLQCPMSQTAPMIWATRCGEKGWWFKFDPQECSACPSRARCVSEKASFEKGRSVWVVPEREHLIRDHLKRRAEVEFRERLAKRQAAEHAIAGFAQCGGKQARRFGGGQVGFDSAISALAYNLRRLGSLARADLELQDRLIRALLRILILATHPQLKRLTHWRRTSPARWWSSPVACAA